MDKERLEVLIGALAHVRLRPGMYFSDDVPAVMTFVHGFEFACHMFGVELEPEYSEIWKGRGWKRSNLNPIHEMQRAGIPLPDIASEAFAVLILTIQRKYGISADPILKLHQDMRERSQSWMDSNKAKDDHHRERIERDLQAMEQLEQEMGISSSDSEDQ